MEGGFGSTYPPPGEVSGLRFVDGSILAWDPEWSAGKYNLYRDLLGNLSGLGFGGCEQPGLTGTTVADATPMPPPGDGHFFLVTVENRLAEEGTKGFRTDGAERLGSVCP